MATVTVTGRRRRRYRGRLATALLLLLLLKAALTRIGPSQPLSSVAAQHRVLRRVAKEIGLKKTSSGQCSLRLPPCPARVPGYDSVNAVRAFPAQPSATRLAGYGGG